MLIQGKRAAGRGEGPGFFDLIERLLADLGTLLDQKLTLLTIELKNEGERAHTFTVTEQSVDQEVQPGDEAEADVTFPESGELSFICKFHESSGMVGALEPSS